MKLTILGGGGVWPTARQACGGYLVEHEGFSVLIDPGYAVLPRLLAVREVADLDAVIISHGHLDHCADLLPLLRARAMGDDELTPLPVFAPRGALDAILAAERIRSVNRAAAIETIEDGDALDLGPFAIEFALLPHHVRTAGMRLTAGGHTLAYTGDSGDCPDRAILAKGADLLLAEATFPGEVPTEEAPYLSSARQVARLALESDARATVLTHQWPDDPVEWALASVRREGLSSARVAFAGMVVDLEAPADARSPIYGRRAAQDVHHPRAIPVLPRRAAS